MHHFYIFQYEEALETQQEQKKKVGKFIAKEESIVSKVLNPYQSGDTENGIL